MARQLTTFSKLLITMLIVGGITAGGWFLTKKTDLLDGVAKDAIDNANSSSSDDDNTINVGVVTWGGYAGGEYFNEGFDANTKSRYYKDYGFKVAFKVLDDFDASRKAFDNDEIDLLWTTIDAFPTESGARVGNPQIVFQSDWSRGGDAIVVRRGITKVSDLKGKKIAVAQMTPSHSFLLWLLEAGDISINDVTPVYVADAIRAAEMFKSQEVDAAVVWSPDDEASLRAVPGSKILQNTRSASHIIADGFMAKKAFINDNKKQLQQLYEGWMIGAAEINNSQANKKKAAKILAAGLNIPEGDAMSAMNNVRLTTHGDNQDFFGLNTNYKNVTASDLYNKMKIRYSALGGDFAGATADAPSWRLVSNATAVQSTNLSGPEHAGESISFAPASKAAEKAEAIATKGVSISFRTGEFKLDENSKYIIDKEFVDIAKSFSNSRIRIEGNTDKVGNRASNIALSKKRANAVAKYLETQYGMSPNRFIVVGNGPDKPVCRESTDACNAKNRRTDFELVAQ